MTAVNRALSAVFDRHGVDPARVATGGFSDRASYALSLGLADGHLAKRLLALSPGFESVPHRKSAASFLTALMLATDPSTDAAGVVQRLKQAKDYVHHAAIPCLPARSKRALKHRRHDAGCCHLRSSVWQADQTRGASLHEGFAAHRLLT